MFFDIIIYVTILTFININISQADKAPIVVLPHGKIEGRILSSPEGNKRYYAYQEIPYAAPPVGKRRFKEPAEPVSWKGVLDTTHNTRSCFLSGSENELPVDVTQSEDCLYLNVYTTLTPGSNSSDLFPVLFWIHGGGFIYGDGTFQSYGPQFLIDYGIVIVTINYRLGPFGFLTTEDDVIPGNLGLKDQHFALKWVKRNIELFGGDPTKITIVGESAGGASVGYHLVSKKSKGLFRAAVLQSGTAVSFFGLQLTPKYFAFKLGQALDPTFTSTNSSALLALLRSVPATDINNIVPEIPDENGKVNWIPVIESANYKEAFVTGPMYDNIKKGNIVRVPIIIGFNSEEMIPLLYDVNIRQRAENMDNDPSTLAELYNMTTEHKLDAGVALKKLYTTRSFQENHRAVVKYSSDSVFTTPSTRHAELQSKYTDVFLYQFSYKGPMGRMNSSFEGVAHTEDLRYLWHTDILDNGTVFPEDDIRTQRRLLTLWSNFVKYLNPTPKKVDIFENISWPTVSPHNIVYLNINKTLTVRTNPRKYTQYTRIVDKYILHPLNTY